MHIYFVQDRSETCEERSCCGLFKVKPRCDLKAPMLRFEALGKSSQTDHGIQPDQI